MDSFLTSNTMAEEAERIVLLIYHGYTCCLLSLQLHTPFHLMMCVVTDTHETLGWARGIVCSLWQTAFLQR